jgi:hypothetical protein
MVSYQRIYNSFQMNTEYYSQYVSILFNDKGNKKITELRTILQRESQNS